MPLAFLPARRAALGRAARRRAEEVLDWQSQAQAYVGVFAKVLGRPNSPARPAAWPFTPRSATRPALETAVDLADPIAFEQFLVSRGRPGHGARGRSTTSTVLE